MKSNGEQVPQMSSIAQLSNKFQINSKYEKPETNGLVNAHWYLLYTIKRVKILWYIAPVQRQMKPLGHI